MTVENIREVKLDLVFEINEVANSRFVLSQLAYPPARGLLTHLGE